MAFFVSVRAVFFALLAATVLAQPPPQMQGIQLGNLSLGVDFRFPETVKQCEPVIMYCKTMRVGYSLYLLTPDNVVFLRIPIPNGTYYIEWICDIPAGYGFTASYYERAYFVVQPGSSNSCLNNITTTYADGRYDTTVFESYTANPPNTTVPYIDPFNSPSLTFPVPTAHHPTITVNPALDAAPTAPTAPPSPSVSSSPARLSRSQVAVLIIGIFVGLLMITISGIILVKRSRRLPVSSRGIANTFDAPHGNPESSKSGARDSLPLSPRRTVPPFQPPWNASDLNWIDRSDAASQTSRVEPMAVDDEVNYLPTEFVPGPAVNPFDSPDDPPTLSRTDADSDVDAALAALSRVNLDNGQREALIVSLNSSSDAMSIFPGPAEQDSDALAAQTVISRLDKDQRRQLAAALTDSTR